MMGFLSPALLALATAVAVPLVLHLFQRQHGRKVIFPALRYLRRAEKENARRIKLRQLLLLALRMTALVLLALAAARPFVRAPGDGHPPTAVVIILDNSLSSGLIMGDTRLFDELKARALETLSQANADDRFWLIRAAQPWEPALPGGAEVTARRVAETRVVAGGSDLGAAIERARALLESGAEGRAREIHLLTDLQASALEHVPPAREDDAPLLVWSPRTLPSGNRGVAAVDIGAGFVPRAGERSNVSARVVGEDEADTVAVRLVLENQVTAAATVPSGAAAVLPFPPRPAGIHTGWVEIDADALRGDDRHYFVAHVQPPPTVALAEPVPFLAEALDVLADAGRIELASSARADIVIAPGAAGVGALRSGRTVIVFPPASSLELPAANRRLAAAGLGWSFAPSVAAGEARLAVEDEADELVRALGDARLRETYRLERDRRAPADSVLLRLRDGTAWAIRGTHPEGGRYILIGTPLSPEASTLPTSTAMVPLLDRLIGTWAAAEPPRSQALPGEAIVLAESATSVERPDGTREEVVPGASFRAPSEAGIYKVLAGETVVDAFAVNPPASESDLDRLEGARLRAAFGDWRPVLVQDANGWARTVFHDRSGRETWRPLVLLALAILLVEALVATAGRGREESANRGPESVLNTMGAGAKASEPRIS